MNEDRTFLGNGKTIIGLTIEYGDATYAGLFGQLGENGMLKNLTLKDVNITAAYYTGAEAGRNNGTIENCSVSDTVKSSSNNAGGITGMNYGTITGCTASGYVSAGFATSGIVSNFVEGKITDCHSYATVEGSNSVGGVEGHMDGLTLFHYYFNIRIIRFYSIQPIRTLLAGGYFYGFERIVIATQIIQSSIIAYIK